MEELAKYGAAGVGIAGFAVIYYLVSKFLAFLQTTNDQFINRFVVAIDNNTEVTKETHDFLKNLNGKLTGIVRSQMDKNSN